MSSLMSPKPLERAALRNCSTKRSHCPRSRAITSTGTRSRASKATSTKRDNWAASEGSRYTACLLAPSATGTASWKGEPRHVFKKGGTSKNAAPYVCRRKVLSELLPMEPDKPRIRWYFRKTRGLDMTKSLSWNKISRPKPSWKLRHSSAKDQAFEFARPPCKAQYLPISLAYTKSSPHFSCFARHHSWHISRTTLSAAGWGLSHRASCTCSTVAPFDNASATDVAISLSSSLGYTNASFGSSSMMSASTSSKMSTRSS
mmetsp:Transcript_37758/g.108970  ORF Transcript_37758/g.108970 Transcript_37758/m.108970 type:complete len:259 (-) Transcript_37758:1412-2188(-)